MSKQIRYVTRCDRCIRAVEFGFKNLGFRFKKPKNFESTILVFKVFVFFKLCNFINERHIQILIVKVKVKNEFI